MLVMSKLERGKFRKEGDVKRKIGSVFRTAYLAKIINQNLLSVTVISKNNNFNQND